MRVYFFIFIALVISQYSQAATIDLTTFTNENDCIAYVESLDINESEELNDQCFDQAY